MDVIKNTIYSRVRNTRIAFLIDRAFPADKLLKLIKENYDLWGGGYNPIIPLSDSRVEANWISMLEQADPDLVYYSEGVDLDLLKAQGLGIYPREYVELVASGIWNLPGANAYAFLETYFRGSAERKHISLVYFDHGLNHPLRQFYELNFGVRPHYVQDEHFVQDFKTSWIDQENIGHTLSYMYSRFWYSKNLLSEMMICNEILRAENAWEALQFELVIYQEGNAFDDLLYFWNRKLYQTPTKKIRQMVISEKELEALKGDTFFLAALKQIAGESSVDLGSKSLDTTVLKEIANAFNTLQNGIILNAKPDISFPYSFEQVWQRDNTEWIKTLIKGDEGFIDVRNQGSPLGLVTGRYELDIRMIMDKNRDVNKVKFPYHYLLRKSVSSIPGRVNRAHDLSFSISHIDQGIDIRVPDFAEILSSRVQIRHVAGELERPEGLISCNISPAGLKLSAFVKLFKMDWNLIRSYPMDKFWLEVFTGTSGYNKVEALWQQENEDTEEKEENDERRAPGILSSKVLKGNGIFSLKDLEHELKIVYYKHQGKIREKFRGGELVLDDDFLVQAVEQESHDDILHALDRFVELEAVFIGLNVKCPHCSSNLWYPLKELSHRMNCRGCDHPVSPKPESVFYYRVNDVIMNNLMSDPVKRTKEFYGNYVVLRTLEYLRSDFEMASASFGYSPCLDIEYTINPEAEGEDQVNTMTDLDIVALQNGKLVLGEAKVQASAFKGDQINQLIWIGKHIKPDILILAYKEGQIPEEKLDRIRKGIGNQNVLVQAYRIVEPWFQFGHLFGVPL